MLIKISNVSAVHDFNGANVSTWITSGSGFNYRLLANGDSCDIRIYSSTNIANQPVQAFPFNVVAELSQFKFAAPFIGGYQILPRSLSDFSVATGVNTLSNDIPDSYKLSQNYPNPFNPSTNIRYNIAAGGDVSLKVFDMLGNEVAVLVNEKQNAGSYEVKFSAGSLSSGIYFYKLQTGNFTEAKKMILIK
ncbi:MAG: T9SS type A sorting domain-containing protein [Bacteroidetes bacterium]|nr:T9SS type A sorting domain-containing protein [Bacteroidota bacterium]